LFISIPKTTLSDTVLRLGRWRQRFVFFDYNEMGVFHGGFASSSSQPFASVPHDGVLRVCFFSLSRYHTFCVWACSFLITEAATFPIVTINSLTVHGSTSFIKEKEYRHIERRFDGTGRGGGVCFATFGVLDLLGGYMGDYLV
jgi:hypothetical protein